MLKVALVARLGKHLFEMHWRVSAQPVTWVNYLAFYLFLSLGVLSLVALGQSCRGVGIKAVRRANTAVLSLALGFIFLTFHEGNKNYLYPIMSGVLSWQSLGPYLSLNFFFRPPFLAAWLVAYAVIYGILARTHREAWTLHLTALFAGGYGLIHLRELILYRNELLVANCLGIASVLAAWRPSQSLHPFWSLVPGIWALLFWGLFGLVAPELQHLQPYFVLLLGGSLVLFGGITLLARRQGFFQGWVCLLPFYLGAFLLFANVNYPTAENYNHLLCLAVTSPRYFLGELVVAGAFGLCGAGYYRFRSGAGLWWLDLLNLVLITIALIDLKVSQIMGVRLGWDVLALGNSPKMMWRMSQAYLPGALAGVVLVVVVYGLLLRGLPRRPGRGAAELAASSPGKGLWYITTCFVLLSVLGIAVARPDKAQGQSGLRLVFTVPFWQRMTQRSLTPEAFLSQASALRIGDFALHQQNLDGAQPPRGLNVVLIFQESSFNQHLSLFSGSQETQPLLSRYKDRMELFPNFFSSFASSIHARFATFTSLYPVLDSSAFTIRRVGVKSLFEVLQDYGYTCSLFDSSFLDYTGFRDFLQGRGIEEAYDADTMPGLHAAKRVSWGVSEEETLAAIRGQIKKYAANRQRFCLTYLPVAPHYPYDDTPKAFDKFKPAVLGDFTPSYLNELLFMDWVVASIVDQLKESHLLEDTLVIITNDHGEMLGGGGGPIGHGWKLTPELVNSPLIVMDPQNPGYHLNYTIGSQVDLLPTVLDRLQIPLPSDQLYEGRSLYAAEARVDRFIYLNSFQQFGVLSGNHLILGDRQLSGGNAGPGKLTVYAISNQGSKTVFTEETAVVAPTIAIGQFDEFQENLVRNYSLYSKALRKTQRLSSSR